MQSDALTDKENTASPVGADGPSSPKKRLVYLDQTVYGHMLDECRDWKCSKTGSILLQAQKQGVAEVWIGPTHVLETIQCEDENRRQRLALMMLNVIEARRMWWGHEFEILQDLCNFIEVCVGPEGFRFPQYLDYRKETMRQIWLGGLGLIASVGTAKFEAAMEQLKRIKVTSRLMQARLATNPDWINRIIKAVEEWETTSDDINAAFNLMSLQDMENEIASHAENIQPLTKDHLRRLNANRSAISRAYGAVETGMMLSNIVNLPCELALVFRLSKIKESLIELEKRENKKYLLPEVRDSRSDDLLQPSLTAGLFQAVIRAASDFGLITAYVGYETILLEMQKRFNARKLPSGGLTFDADHTVALVRFDVFMTEDKTFGESLKSIVKRIVAQSHGKHSPVIVMNPKQLAKAIGMPS